MRIAVAYESQVEADSTVSLTDSAGNKAHDLGDILMLLVNQHSEDGNETNVDHVCWNLDDTVAPICRLLGHDLAAQLYTKKSLKCKVQVREQVVPFELFYIPDKLFTVERRIKRKYRDHLIYDRTSLYGIDQYFNGMVQPKSLSDVANLCKVLRNTLKEMGFSPTKLTSPAAIYEECILSHLNLPTYKDIPPEANQYAYMCGGELWIEAHKLGYWKEIDDWDLIASFPSVIATLIDTRNCEWIKREKYIPEALYGYCKGIVDIPESVTISPILLKRQEKVDISPTGRWPTYLTKAQIDYLISTKRGHFDIEDGWWAILKEQKTDYTLANLVNSLVALRGKDKLVDFLAKRMAVSLYGKFGEEHNKDLGKHFNPVWFAEISTRIGLQVARFIYDHNLGNALIHIGVDGVMLDRALIPADFVMTTEEQAIWKRSYQGEALVSSSGMVMQGAKKPHGLTLQDVKSLIRAQPDSYEYSKIIRSRVILGEALQYKFEDLGIEMDKPATLSLLSEHDRYFQKIPQSGRELRSNKYSSRPFKIDELNTPNIEIEEKEDKIGAFEDDGE